MPADPWYLCDQKYTDRYAGSTAATDPEQEWESIPVSNGAYMIWLAGTQLYLTSADAKEATNSPIVLADKQDGQLQIWTIYEQHPTF